MTTLTRLLVCAILAGGLLAASGSVCPEWFANTGLDFWKLPELYLEMEHHREVATKLNAIDERIKERLTARQTATDLLMQGKIDLREAASRFHEVNMADEGFMAQLRETYRSARTDEERSCRQLLGWAESHAALNPASEVEERLKRLHEELEELLAKEGGLRLRGR